jgi:hypothetical protein
MESNDPDRRDTDMRHLSGGPTGASRTRHSGMSALLHLDFSLREPRGPIDNLPAKADRDYSEILRSKTDPNITQFLQQLLGKSGAVV